MVGVDAPDSGASREWLRRYVKDVLMERFQQEAIYIKFVGPIEQMIVIQRRDPSLTRLFSDCGARIRRLALHNAGDRRLVDEVSI